ncbi:hypothetical protein Hanom_Chr12g01081341 [Helianthus anomalus]
MIRKRSSPSRSLTHSLSLSLSIYLWFWGFEEGVIMWLVLVVWGFEIEVVYVWWPWFSGDGGVCSGIS